MSAERAVQVRHGRGNPGGRGWPAVLLPLLLLAGCGYFGGGTLAFEFDRIALAARDEVTARTELRPALLAAVTARLVEDGRIRLVEPPQAQAILESRVTALASEPVAFGQGDVARRFRVVLTLEVTLRDRTGNGMLLKETVTGEAYYSAPTGIAGIRVAEEEGIRRAVEEAATRVALLLLEGF